MDTGPDQRCAGLVQVLTSGIPRDPAEIHNFARHHSTWQASMTCRGGKGQHGVLMQSDGNRLRCSFEALALQTVVVLKSRHELPYLTSRSAAARAVLRHSVTIQQLYPQLWDFGPPVSSCSEAVSWRTRGSETFGRHVVFKWACGFVSHGHGAATATTPLSCVGGEHECVDVRRAWLRPVPQAAQDTEIRRPGTHRCTPLNT
jgi:hypothetical protein